MDRPYRAPHDQAFAGGSVLTPAEFTAIRLRLGLPRSGMAKALRSDHRTIARWENGERPIPGPVVVAMALLAPSEAMVKAGVDYCLKGPGLSGGIRWPDHVRNIYAAMLAAREQLT